VEFLGQLWLPILVAAALCFAASTLIWMLAPHHKNEWSRHPNEEALVAAMRAGEPATGGYIVPVAKWNDQAAMAKARSGPVGTLYLQPGGEFRMGRLMAQQLVFFLVVSVFVAYVAHHALQPGSTFLSVHRIAGAAAFMAYGFATVPESIWFGRPWKSCALTLVDALVYGMVTGVAFGWLWPEA
jgi:hypothetical protein